MLWQETEEVSLKEEIKIMKFCNLNYDPTATRVRYMTLNNLMVRLQ